MSLENEIRVLRAKREAEKQARLAEERDELIAQLTPESIAQKLTQLQAENPIFVEAVSLLQRLNAPVLLSEVATHFGLQPKVMEPLPSVVLDALGWGKRWDSPLGKIIRKERYIPTIGINTGEEKEKCAYVSIGCSQMITRVSHFLSSKINRLI